jgi:hypothetical protein
VRLAEAASIGELFGAPNRNIPDAGVMLRVRAFKFVLLLNQEMSRILKREEFLC